MLVLEKANNNRKPRGLFEGNGSVGSTFTNVMISECSVCVDTAVISPRRFKILMCISSFFISKSGADSVEDTCSR